MSTGLEFTDQPSFMAWFEKIVVWDNVQKMSKDDRSKFMFLCKFDPKNLSIVVFSVGAVQRMKNQFSSLLRGGKWEIVLLFSTPHLICHKKKRKNDQRWKMTFFYTVFKHS